MAYACMEVQKGGATRISCCLHSCFDNLLSLLICANPLDSTQSGPRASKFEAAGVEDRRFDRNCGKIQGTASVWRHLLGVRPFVFMTL